MQKKLENMRKTKKNETIKGFLFYLNICNFLNEFPRL